MGTLFQAFGQIKAGQTAQAQGEFNKEIAIRNQKALKRQAKAARDAAAMEESRISRKGKIVQSSQRAAAGKSGVGLGGATLSVLADTVAQFSIDRNLTLRRGLIRSRELIEKGKIIRARGQFAATLGRQAKRLSYIQATGTVLSTPGLGFPEPQPPGGSGLKSGGQFINSPKFDPGGEL